MRVKHETQSTFRHPDWAGIEGKLNGMLGAAAWARRQGPLSRWAPRDAALVQLGLAALAWSFLALLVRWSLGW